MSQHHSGPITAQHPCPTLHHSHLSSHQQLAPKTSSLSTPLHHVSKRRAGGFRQGHWLDGSHMYDTSHPPNGWTAYEYGWYVWSQKYLFGKWLGSLGICMIYWKIYRSRDEIVESFVMSVVLYVLVSWLVVCMSGMRGVLSMLSSSV